RGGAGGGVDARGRSLRRSAARRGRGNGDGAPFRHGTGNAGRGGQAAGADRRARDQRLSRFSAASLTFTPLVVVRVSFRNPRTSSSRSGKGELVRIPATRPASGLARSASWTRSP